MIQDLTKLEHRDDTDGFRYMLAGYVQTLPQQHCSLDFTDCHRRLEEEQDQGTIDRQRTEEEKKGGKQCLDPGTPKNGLTASSQPIEAKERLKSLSNEQSNPPESTEVRKEVGKKADRDRNLFDGIGVGGDSCQVLVSTVGEPITARNITAGPRSMQIIGQISDHSLHRFMRIWRKIELPPRDYT